MSISKFGTRTTTSGTHASPARSSASRIATTAKLRNDSPTVRNTRANSLHIKRRRKRVAFAVCLGLTVAFAWAVFVAVRDSDGWIGFALFLALFGALTVRAAIIMLVPGIGSLTLEADGFSMQYILRTARISWRDVTSDFRAEADATGAWLAAGGRVRCHHHQRMAKRPHDGQNACCRTISSSPWTSSPG